MLAPRQLHYPENGLSSSLFISLHLSLQALDWLQQSGEHYLSTHTSPGATSAETQDLLAQHREFCISAKVNTHTDPLTYTHAYTHTTKVRGISEQFPQSISPLYLLPAHSGEGAPADPAGREHAG